MGNDYRHSFKSVREDFKSRGVFYTPPELAEFIKSLLPDDVDEIYDPSCGNGGLLAVFGDNVKKYGQDIYETQVAQAYERLKNFEGVAGDTLENPAFMGRKFRYIVANPPFSVKWREFSDERFENAPCLPPKSKADYAFILHILYMLAEGGKAVIMEFPGILYRSQREGKIRRWLIENNVIEKVIAVPGKKFEDTQIATCILVLNKSKNTADIVFRDEENGIERTVELSEISANDFTLSVNTYIQTEPEKEEINPIELNRNVMRQSVSQLEQDINLNFQFASIFPEHFPDLLWYVDEISRLDAIAQKKLKDWLAKRNENNPEHDIIRN